MLKFCFILVFFIVFIIPLPVSNAYLKLNYENYRHEIGKINKQKQEIRLQKIIQCESDGIHEGTWGDNGKSYGWLQFQKESFYHIAKHMGFENAKWKRKKDQYTVAKWGIENGYAKWWTCYRKLYGNVEIN